jgi:C-terminal processing protease CtpA/Prc
MKKIILASLFSILFITISCNNKDDDFNPEISTLNDEINFFIWKGLFNYYLWEEEIPNLAENKLNDFLLSNRNNTPENVFESLLYRPTDRFSWIVDDYIELDNRFQGISLSNGMEFKLFANKTNSNKVYGVVYYVITNSDAYRKGVLRGMVFSSINGTEITTSNYRALLFGSNTDYSLYLADFNAGNPKINGTIIDLTKEKLQENPVAITKVFDEGAGKKIGYLFYNQFASSFDGELNAAFNTFKSENIDNLIIDLRYNGGGSVSTATYLASMINGDNNGKLFAQEFWNENFMNSITNSDFFLNNFTDRILNKDSSGNIILDQSINSLSLQKVYFIVTDDTASASELVINGMKPYLNVYLVGTKTVGKQVGSITLYDSDNLFKTGNNLNPDHRYAMQPIVLEIKNVNGENSTDGYQPDIELPEDFGGISGPINLGVLGEKSDPLLDQTITFIKTSSRFSSKKTSSYFQEKSLINSRFLTRFSQEMYVDLKK